MTRSPDMPLAPAGPDADLLAAVARGDGAALGELARRYVDFVYAAAVRQLGDRHAAEDVTQAVFLVLARKAGRVRAGALAAWLHRTTVYAAANARRAARRRKRHELAAAKSEADMSETPPDAATQRLLARLDEAIAALPAKDRIAVCGRYLRGNDLAAIAAVLGTTPAAAQKRIERAVEGLRRRLPPQDRPSAAGGAVVPAAVLAAIELAAPSPATAAPPTLAIAAATPAAASIANGVVLMTLASKAKVAAAVAVALLLGGVAVEGVRRYAAPAAPAFATRPTSIDPALVGGWRTVQEAFSDGVLSPATAAGQSIEIAADGQCRLHFGGTPDESARLEPVASGEIDFVLTDGTRRLARYAVEGDRLRLRHAAPNGPRPAPFDEPLADGVTEIELRRTTDLAAPLLATFEDGAAVELLTVGDPATGQWWKPDGRPTDPPAGVGPRVPATGIESKPGFRPLVLVTAVHGPVVGRHRPEPNDNGPMTWWPQRGNRPGTVSVIQVKTDATTIDWHTDLAHPPQTVSLTPDAAGDWAAAHERQVRSPGGRTFHLSTTTDGKGRRAFVLRPSVAAFEADDASVTLFDARGREVPTVVQPVDSLGGPDLHYRPMNDQPADVAEARLTLHHYDRWAEFRGVATRAGSPATPTAVTSETAQAFTATFADGVSVELLAIGDLNADQWWTPDGAPTTKPADVDLAPKMGGWKTDKQRQLCFVTETRGAGENGIARGRLNGTDQAEPTAWGQLRQTGSAPRGIVGRDATTVLLDAATTPAGLHLDVAATPTQSVSLRPDAAGRWDAATAVQLTTPDGLAYTLSPPRQAGGRVECTISPFVRNRMRIDDLTVWFVRNGDEWPCALEPVEDHAPPTLRAWSGQALLAEVKEVRLTLRRYARGVDFSGIAWRPGEKVSPRVVVKEPPSRDRVR